MAETQNTEPIVRATGIPWDQWVASLDAQGARTLDHTSIAQLVLAQMPQIRSKHWWAQSVAIAYEQHVGLRVVGQSCDGTYAANASKTIAATLDEALERWQQHMGKPEELDGTPSDGEPSTSQTEKWRYWRLTMADGSKINVSISAKGPDKTILAIQHAQLDSEDERERWKAFWKTQLVTF